MRITSMMAGLFILLFSIFLVHVSAMTIDGIMENGNAAVGTTLVVGDIPEDADIFFIMNNGIPVFAKADANGTARYLPLVEGILTIDAMRDGDIIDNATLNVGPAVTSTPTPSGGGTGSRGGSSGGTGGGTGVNSREPLSNVAQHETEENDLMAGKSITYSFTDPGIAIYQLVVTGSQDEDKIAIRVESLNGTSKLAGEAAPGNIFANINIWSGSNNINSILVRFKVDNSWISDNNIQSSDINLLRWDQNKWISLDTTEINKDDKYTYFEANTTGLPTFAISTGKGATIPSGTETPSSVVSTPEITNTAIPAPAKTKASGFEIVLAIVGIFAIYIARKVRLR